MHSGVHVRKHRSERSEPVLVHSDGEGDGEEVEGREEGRVDEREEGEVELGCLAMDGGLRMRLVGSRGGKRAEGQF